jgi:hypothetical protein
MSGSYGESVPRPGPGEPEVYQITDAISAHSDDLEARMARYLISMLIRTACVVLVFVVDGPLRWVFAVGAVGLPYVAVIAANNSGGRRGRPTGLGTPTARRSALGFSTAPDGPRVAGGGSTVTGESSGIVIGEAPVLLTGVVEPAPERPTGNPPPEGTHRQHDTRPEPLRDSA